MHHSLLAVFFYLQSETDKSKFHLTFHFKTIISFDACLKHLGQTTVLQHALNYCMLHSMNESVNSVATDLR